MDITYAPQLRRKNCVIFWGFVSNLLCLLRWCTVRNLSFLKRRTHRASVFVWATHIPLEILRCNFFSEINNSSLGIFNDSLIQNKSSWWFIFPGSSCIWCGCAYLLWMRNSLSPSIHHSLDRSDTTGPRFLPIHVWYTIFLTANCHILSNDFGRDFLGNLSIWKSLTSRDKACGRNLVHVTSNKSPKK